MATPNYGYEKRQRELAKKRKKEEKAARKAAGLPALPDSETMPADPAAAGTLPPHTESPSDV